MLARQRLGEVFGPAIVASAALLATMALSFVGMPGRAHAQDECEGSLLRAPIDMIPAVGAFGVTLGAALKVRYPAGYFEDPVIAADPATSIEVRVADTGAVLAGSVSVIDDVLVFVPDRALDPRTRYEGTAFGFDQDFDFRFTSGSIFDTTPPTMDALTSMSSTRIEEPSCDAPDGGYRIDVSFPAATDDGPPGDIEYYLFLTRGPSVDAPVLKKRVRNQTPGEVIMAFVLDPSEATSPICVSVLAMDGVGNVSGGDDVICADPVDGSFFEPLCTVSAAGAERGPSGAPLAAGVAVAAVAALGRGRRRRRHRRGCGQA